MFLPNGVDADFDIDKETALDLLAQNDARAEQLVLFAAGRIIPTKGCHYLIQAFQNVGTDSNLIIVGDTSQLPKYERKLRELADNRVRFLPFISKKEVLFGLYSSAHLFVFPSTVEAMSMVLLEVSALGIPIICSDIPENRSVLSEFALFFKSGDSDDLAEKLDWALQHPQEMQILAMNAQRRVHRVFRWDIIVRQYQAIYEAVAAKQQRPSFEQAFKDRI
jgi:glycosyltransferase involved in cell wall biosynthesis